MRSSLLPGAGRLGGGRRCHVGCERSRLTRDQVAPIPGVIPTIKVGPNGAPAKAAPAADESQGGNPLSLVKETTYGTLGASDAAQLWIFVDPFCSFSVNAMRQLAPYVQSGKVRLSVIPLSVLDYEDLGRSTPARSWSASQRTKWWRTGLRAASPAHRRRTQRRCLGGTWRSPARSIFAARRPSFGLASCGRISRTR
jgi:hypothetical protein